MLRQHIGKSRQTLVLHEPRVLPGLEPDRTITDWGRSERLTALADGTVLAFLYHYWLRVAVEGVENFEGKQVHYKIKNVADFHGRNLVIFGGGDSALDWVLNLHPFAERITLLQWGCIVAILVGMIFCTSY